MVARAGWCGGPGAAARAGGGCAGDRDAHLPARTMQDPAAPSWASITTFSMIVSLVYPLRLCAAHTKVVCTSLANAGALAQGACTRVAAGIAASMHTATELTCPGCYLLFNRQVSRPSVRTASAGARTAPALEQLSLCCVDGRQLKIVFCTTLKVLHCMHNSHWSSSAANLLARIDAPRDLPRPHPPRRARGAGPPPPP